MERAPDISKLRNIGIIAHIDAGKTTTTERILYYAGVTHALGNIDDGSTQMDWMDQERERGITITAAATRVVWREHDINLIDTPGHVDFTAEVERSLRVLDGAVVVLCAVGGVEPQSEMVWHQADHYEVPRLVFVNKMDRVGANFEAVLDDLRATLGAEPLPLCVPVGAEDQFHGVVDLVRGRYLRWVAGGDGALVVDEEIPEAERERCHRYRQQMLETLAAEDDFVLAAFVEGRELEAEELTRVIRRGTLRRTFYPVFAGASLRNIGIQPLLDAVVDYLPSPADARPAIGITVGGEERIVRGPDPRAPLLALVFKTYTERERGRASYLRIYSGTVNEGMTVEVPRQKTQERIARLFRVHADKRRPIKEGLPGDIVVATGLKYAATGDTLCDGVPLLLEGMTFPEPVVTAALEARTAGEDEKLQLALAKLADDDPTFRCRLDDQTGQVVISGMGELHLQILEERLVREFGLKVRIGRPEVTYRETIRGTAHARGEYDRFTAGREHKADLTLELSPLERGAGLRIENRLPAGLLAPAIVEVVAQACRDAAETGLQFGYPVVDVCVALTRASWSELHSSDFAFRAAALSAFRDAGREAGPVLLEPIVSLEIVTPKEFVGSVMSALAARQGHVVGSEVRELVSVLEARAPLSKMFGWTTDLRSASQGRATSSMSFSHYDAVSGSVPPGLIRA